MPEQLPKVRARNFDEVPPRLHPGVGHAGSGALHPVQRPRCKQGCPVEIDIPQFIAKIKEGDFEGAIRKLWEKNSLPAVCGRVCPRKSSAKACASSARRTIRWPSATWSASPPTTSGEHGKQFLPPKPTHRQEGGGGGRRSGGLDRGRRLILKGHEVTIFEALHGPGGVLLYGIPEFRLPKAIVAPGM